MKTSILKFALLLFTITLMVTSCKKDDQPEEATTCDIENPLETIPWLKEIRDGFDMQANPLPKRIIQYFYQGECVFLIDGCIGCNDNLIVVYNLDKDVICEFGGIAGVDTCPNFATEATGELVLYGN